MREQSLLSIGNTGQKKLNELLGLPFQKCDNHLTIEYTKEEEEFTDIRFYFQSELGYFVV